jgi:hypothetical protein
MNKENAAQFLPLVQALAEGKTIQYNDNGTWRDTHGDFVAFGNLPEHYRIKPETREFYISFDNGGQIYDCQPVGQPIEKLALGTIIRVREILD